MKKFWPFLFLCMFIILLAACSGTDDADSAGEDGDASEEGGTVKVGVLASLTGALESYGKPVSYTHLTLPTITAV